jgi:hypothetical protein
MRIFTIIAGKWNQDREIRLDFVGPMDALHGALVNGQLDLIFRGPGGVDDLGMSQGFVEAEDLGADRFAITAGDALIGIDYRNFFSHLRSPPV